MAHGRSKQAFTLIELMVSVTILGVLAAIAVPSFTVFIRRSRTAEAPMVLGNLYSAAATLYTTEHAGRHITSSVVTSCIAEPNGLNPATPGAKKQRFTGGPGFDQLSFRLSDFVVFGYGISSIGAAGGVTCVANPMATPAVYTFFAHGDLDEDGTSSTFTLSIAANAQNELYHSRGMYIAYETE